MIRPLQLLQSSESPDLVLSEDEAHSFESAIGSECHASSKNTANAASVTNAFARVNNPASIGSVGDSLADIVRSARKEAGLSQIDLAAAIDMSQRWVSDLEREETLQPRPATMVRLSDVLSIPLADLYVAANMARSKSEAQKLIDEIPIPPDDPRSRIIALVKRVDPENPDSLIRLEGVELVLQDLVRKQGG